MNKVKTNKISKCALSLIAVATLSCSSLSFGMGIFDAIEKNDIMRIGEILKDKNFNVNKVDKDGRTPLYLACRKNNPSIVTLLLDNGADINATKTNGFTPLHIACFDRHPNIVQLLLDRGADINKVEINGQTPLYWASTENYLDIVELLLNNGAKKSINIANLNGFTPLYPACLNKNLDIVKLLLVHGANVDQRSLNVAANDRPKILELLTLVQQYDNSTDKIEFIIEQQDDIKYSILIKRALTQSLNEVQKDGRSIEGTIFGQLYRQLKNDNKFKKALDVEKKCDNIYEFIKHAAEKNHIYLEKNFIDKNIMALKSKASLGKRKFTDTTFKFSEQE